MKNDFTDRFIRNLKPEEKIRDIREKRGFGIRIKPDGVKVFFYGYDSPLTGKRRFLTLGEYPSMSLAEARSEHAKQYDIVKAGGDPLESKRHESESRLKAPSVKDLCEEYIERHAKRFKRSWLKDQRILGVDILPAWGHRKAADIGKRDVVLLLEKIVDRGSPAMANNTFQIVRKMFNWAIEKDLIAHSPCAGVKLPAPKIARDRVLSEAEIKTLWQTLDRCSMLPGTRAALRLVLVLAQRPGEVAGMHTSELEGDWWLIPAERAKNGQAHRVFLPELAKEIISEAIAAAKQARGYAKDDVYEGFVFPCPHVQRNKPITEEALSQTVGRNLKNNNLELEKFVPHDLRRTAGTFMAESGEMDEVIDAVMNHGKRGVIKVYNQYRYSKEKEAALEKWAKRLSRIVGLEVEEGKVIPLRRAPV